MKPEFTRLSNTILNSGLLPGLNRLLETTKNREKKKVATFVTTSVCERKTGLKPATSQPVSQVLTNGILVFPVLLPVRWLNNSFTLNFEMAYLPLVCYCIFHR